MDLAGQFFNSLPLTAAALVIGGNGNLKVKEKHCSFESITR